MTLGGWVLVLAVVLALGFGGWRMVSDGRFRGTHRVRGAERGSGFETGAERPPQPSVDASAGARSPSVEPVETTVSSPRGSVLAGTAYDGQRGERATLLQFSSAFCAPCRATRQVLDDVARSVPGVAHVEVDAEQHLDLVRDLGVLRTPTTLVLDAAGREVTRATGAPRPGQVLAALEATL
ncbi:MAG: thioredoxin family protein [Nocardioides sp.]|nr:thioredoxin family protein [Nocardioides sp.]